MKIPRIVLPLLVLLAMWGGYGLRSAFTQPTTEVVLDSGGTAKLKCVVDGVRCKGTASFFTKLYEGKPGVSSIETFASEHTAIFTYDPSVITPAEIQAIMEAPIPLGDGREVQAFRCMEMK